MNEKTYYLSKKFRFESAHRLSHGYVGKCANIHGHSWNGEISVQVNGVDEMGLSIDFAELGKITKRWEEMFDHKCFLSAEDSLIDVLSPTGHGIIIFPGNPTCETLCDVLLLELVEACKENEKLKNVVRCSVSIEETCTSRCQVSRGFIR